MKVPAVLFAILALLCAAPVLSQSDGVPLVPTNQSFVADPLNTVAFRVGIPTVTRGPGNDFADEPMTFIKRDDGNGFYVYGSGQVGWAATSPNMLTGYAGAEGQPTCSQPGGTTVTVPGTGDTFCSHLQLAYGSLGMTAITPVTGHNNNTCGDWSNTSYKNPYDGLWYMLVHNEGPCVYNPAPGHQNYTDESMSMWTSTTGAPGTWAPMAVSGLSSGTIISTTQQTIEGWIVGLGDCTMVPDAAVKPVYMYIICASYTSHSVSTYKNVMLRAPIKKMGPGNWMAYYNGCYCQPALNIPYNDTNFRINADMFNWVGAYASTMPGKFPLMAVAWGHVIQPVNDTATNIESTVGFTLAVSYSFEKPDFRIMPVPLLNYDRQDFTGRPVQWDGYFYHILRNDVDGSSVLDPGHFALWYMFVPSNNGLESRYIIQQPVTVKQVTPAMLRAGYPRVGVALETYNNTSTGKAYSGRLRTTTVSPMPGTTSSGATETGWNAQSFLGYVMTACSQRPATSKEVNQCSSADARFMNSIEECWSSSNDDYQLHVNSANTVNGACPSGWQHQRTVGWLYKHPQWFATKPVYACLNSGANYHFASNDNACSGQTSLGLLGYAAAS